MNKALLEKEAQEFIATHLQEDTAKIILKGASIEGVSIQELVEQIEAKLKCKKKLPTFFAANGIYYPTKLNIEQSSSEVTAEYKSHLISGQTMIDLTGGFGVDCLYFSKRFESVTHCERNKELSQIAAYNIDQLGIDNVDFQSEDGLQILENIDQTYDCIYLDPSRRHHDKGKVFFLSDCEPIVPKNLELLFTRSETILIKTSPLLDITAGLRELNDVHEIHIVAINNEVKELLWLLKYGANSVPTIKTVNIVQHKMELFEFQLAIQSSESSLLSLPKAYAYEPNAAIMKSGGFVNLSQKMKVAKLHEHSHLYTSDSLIEFPGRQFKIMEVMAYQKHKIKKRLPKKANVSIRNFPESVSQLRKKFKIADGGHVYLFFTTNLNNEKIVLLCEKV